MIHQSEQINELATALAKAQGEIENATKTSNNPHFKSKYADLAEVVNSVRPVFAANQLAFTQAPSYSEGIANVTTTIMHSSGQWLRSTCSCPVGKQDAQGVGSAITYLRRYSLAAVAGLAQEDDDAENAVGRGSKTKHADPSPVVGEINKAESVQALQEVFAAAYHMRSGYTAEAWRAIEEAKDRKKGQLAA